jgi:hypothetical protein
MRGLISNVRRNGRHSWAAFRQGVAVKGIYKVPVMYSLYLAYAVSANKYI